MHYTKLELKNFRGFSEIPEIKFAPLTFLVGPNSSGKSSIFDALLLLSQSGFSPLTPNARIPVWQGSLVDLGSYKDTVYRHEIERGIEIKVDVSYADADNPRMLRQPPSAKNARFEFRMSCAGRTDPIGYLSSAVVTDTDSDQSITFTYPQNNPTKVVIGLSGTIRRKALDALEGGSYFVRIGIREFIDRLNKQKNAPKSSLDALLFFATTPSFGQFSSRIQRISSGRIGPKRWYSAVGEKSAKLTRGLYEGVDPEMIEEVRRYEDRKLERASPKHRQKIGRLLKELDIASEVKDYKLSPYHTAINVKDNVTKVVSNLIDVGYGASQVLPVILACLSRSKSPLLVEQPEIHLHPRAQATVAELLCTSSKQRQVIVETHSEHMINRARILVAERKISSSDVVIIYVSRQKSGSEVKHINILENGDFSEPWPDGFFDERYRDTMQLLDLKNKIAKR